MAVASGSLALKFFQAAVVCSMLLVGPSLLVHHVAQAQTISCRQVVNNLTPCVDYLINGGALASTSSCCNGVKTLYGRATTMLNRRAVCSCLKSALSSISYNANNLRNAQQLPGKCGVKVPYKIDPGTDCSKIH